MQFLKQLWLSIRSNPVFVFLWTGFVGALVSQLETSVQSGIVTWDAAAWKRMIVYAGVTSFIGVVHLYTPQPGSNPNQK